MSNTRLTQKEIERRLRSVQNEYNTRDLDEDSVLRYALLIMYDEKKKRKRSRKEKESLLLHIMDEHYRELVKEYSNVVIAKGKYGKHYIYIKTRRGLYSPMDVYVSERLGTTVDDVYRKAEVFNKIHREKCVQSQVEFPTGNLLFANFFKNSKCDDYAFEMPDDLKYKSGYSINHSYGEQATMDVLSQTHGLGYVQLGNTSAAVYKVNDDKLVMCTLYPYDYDDEAGEVEVPIPGDWELLGEVCCDVWRVEFIDQANFDKGDAVPIDHKEYQYNPVFKGKVNPGTWHVKNRYHYMNDETFLKKGEIPIWVELNRVV